MFRSAALRLSLLSAVVAVAACSGGTEAPTAASAAVAGSPEAVAAKKPPTVAAPTVRAFGYVNPISGSGLLQTSSSYGVAAAQREGVGRYCVTLAAPVQYAVVVATVHGEDAASRVSHGINSFQPCVGDDKLLFTTVDGTGAPSDAVKFDFMVVR